MDALFIPAEVSAGETYKLAKRVCVIQILPTGDGERARLGHLTDLQQGAEVQICGTGFNERTVKVRCDGHFYFAFSDNLLMGSEIVLARPKQQAAGRGCFE